MLTSKSICFTITLFEDLTADEGLCTYYLETAKLLSENGWKVAVLVYGDDGGFAQKFYNGYGIPIYNAVELCKGADRCDLKELMRMNNRIQSTGHVLHEAIQVLTRNYGHSFDLIEFPEQGGAASVPVNLKKNLGFYEGSGIIVKLHGPSQWHDDGCELEWRTFEDVAKYHFEKYSFENADIQVSPTRYMYRWCEGAGWKVKPEASICAYPFPVCPAPAAIQGLRERDEIVFFGRLDERNGLGEFLDSLKYIRSSSPAFQNRYTIVFMGTTRKMSQADIENYLAGFRCKFLSLSGEAAVRYLSANARLVVMPSKLDNFPRTVLECMAHGLPFVTTGGSGISEMLGEGSELSGSVSCSPGVESLGDLIIRYLGYPDDRVCHLAKLAHGRCWEITDRSAILHWYEDALRTARSPLRAVRSEEGRPGVTVIVPTRDRTTAVYLETTIKTLLSQSHRNIEVIVEDSSTEPEAIKRLEGLHKIYPQVRFIHEDNEGIGSALNKALPRVRTKYVMEVDGDNLARPEMVETFVGCMERRKDVAALSCYFAAFRDGDEDKALGALGRDRETPAFTPMYYFSPIGMCLPLLLFNNVQGDANSIYLTDVVRSVGGWPEEKRKGFQDWSMWLKLIAYGYDVDVIDRILYYYRYHENNYFKSRMRSSYNVDSINIEYIAEIIKRRPELFAKSCYPLLHKLTRGVDRVYSIFEARYAAENNSTLYLLGTVLGNMASTSPLVKKALVASGNCVKKALKKHPQGG